MEPPDQPQEVQVHIASESFLQVLGQVYWLLLHSKAHKYLFLNDIESNFFPALLCDQFRLFKKDDSLFAFAVWARVSDEIHQRMQKETIKLRPDEWQSGPHYWLIDVVAPFGGEDYVFETLFAEDFANLVVFAMDFTADGKLAFMPVAGKNLRK